MTKRLLRIRTVVDRTGANATDIYRDMKAGTFPRSVPIGKRTVGWVEEEIEAWITARIEARDDDVSKRRAGPGRGHKGPLVDKSKFAIETV